MSRKSARALSTNFTEGPILRQLASFALPVLLALFLQSLYGAVDLAVVGQFASSADVSAVSTGSQIMQSLTGLASGFAAGVTILLGMRIGAGSAREGGKVVGAGIFFFAVASLLLALGTALGAGRLASLLNAPQEAASATTAYIRICGAGLPVILAYNLIGSVFRGIGDSRTPLVTVAIAAACNVLGDLLLVAVLQLGAAGAAIATVISQLLSVLISLLLIRRRELPFSFGFADIRPDKSLILRIVQLGFPLALSDALVSVSFLIVLSIVNALGLTASAGVGVAEKVCAFIMLFSIAFMQSMSAFVAQNIGAGRRDRALRSLRGGILLSLGAGVALGLLSFFRGDLLAGLFSREAVVIAAAWDYLKAYAIDCVLTSFLFVFIGFFSGIGSTRFVMIQDVIGALCLRVPLSWLFSRMQPVSLFRIGLATPCSSFVQVLICFGALWILRRRWQREAAAPKA